MRSEPSIVAGIAQAFEGLTLFFREGTRTTILCSVRPIPRLHLRIGEGAQRVRFLYEVTPVVDGIDPDILERVFDLVAEVPICISSVAFAR